MIATTAVFFLAATTAQASPVEPVPLDIHAEYNVCIGHIIKMIEYKYIRNDWHKAAIALHDAQECLDRMRKIEVVAKKQEE